MATQINTLNLSDVALVEPRNLGRGLAMLRGITKAELREVDHALWDALGNDPIERLAVLVRFRCLIKVFGARRLHDLLMHTGHNLIAPAVQVAARMRLNADMGFNPVKFERALAELLAKGKAVRCPAATELPLAA